MQQHPHRWMVLKTTLQTEDGRSVVEHRVFGVWTGGYIHGDSWRLNSGIKEIKEDEDFYTFIGFSGSEYVCHKNGYGTSGYGASIIEAFKQQKNLEIEVLPEDTDWHQLISQGIKDDAVE